MGTDGANFDGLDDDVLRVIAQFVPLDMSNLSQLNLRAKRVGLSELQPLFAWTELNDLPQLKLCVDTCMPHLIRKMQSRLLCFK